MPRGRHRTTHEEVEATRELILHTAEQLFMEYGYRAVSTRLIADACGLTQPALYHHFADKQALYVEVIKEATAKTRAALERIVRRSESVQERLQLVVRYLRSSTQHDLSLMLHDIQYELAIEGQNTLNGLFQTCLIAPIATIFEDGLQQGLLRTAQEGGVDAVTAAYLFMSLLSRFIARAHNAHEMQARQAQYPSNDNGQAEIIVQILLYGLVKDNHGLDNPA